MEAAMDKPRRPLVIRPWKTRKTQRNKWEVLTEGKRFDPKGLKMGSSSKIRRAGSKKRD